MEESPKRRNVDLQVEPLSVTSKKKESKYTAPQSRPVAHFEYNFKNAESTSNSSAMNVFADVDILWRVWTFSMGPKDFLMLASTSQRIFRACWRMMYSHFGRLSKYFVVPGVEESNINNSDIFNTFLSEHWLKCKEDKESNEEDEAGKFTEEDSIARSKLKKTNEHDRSSEIIKVVPRRVVQKRMLEILYLKFQNKIRQLTCFSNHQVVEYEMIEEEKYTKFEDMRLTNHGDTNVLRVRGLFRVRYVKQHKKTFEYYALIDRLFYEFPLLKENDPRCYNIIMDVWCRGNILECVKLQKRMIISDNTVSTYFRNNRTRKTALYFFKESVVTKLLEIERLLPLRDERNQIYVQNTRTILDLFERRSRTMKRLIAQKRIIEEHLDFLNRHLPIQIDRISFSNQAQEDTAEEIQSNNKKMEGLEEEEEEEETSSSKYAKMKEEEEEEENTSSSEHRKVGRPKECVQREDFDFDENGDQQSKRHHIDRLSYHLNKEYNNIQQCVEDISLRNRGVPFTASLSYTEKPKFCVTGEYLDGRLENIDKSNLNQGKTATAKELLVEKERTRKSVTMLKDELGTRFGKVDRQIKEGKSQYTPHIYVMGLNDDQVGLYKNPSLIREEKFKEDDYVKEYVREHLKNQHFSNERKRRGLVFESYCTVDHEFVQGKSVVKISAVSLEICDESYSLDQKIKFNAGYMRDLIKKKPLGKKGLYPLLWSTQSMNFFERVESYETGYEQIINNFESKNLFIDISRVKDDIQVYFDDFYDNGTITLSDSVLLEVSDYVKYLSDFAEAKEQAKSSLHPSSSRTNRERAVQFAVGDPCSSTCEMADLKFQPTLRLQYDIISKNVPEYPDGIVPRMYPELDVVPYSLHRQRSGSDFLIDMLHWRGCEYKTDNRFFLERFLKVVFYKWSEGAEDRNWKEEYFNYLKIQNSRRLFKSGSISFLNDNEVKFGSDLSFFDQKINNKFYEHLGDEKDQCNIDLKEKIMDTLDSTTRPTIQKMHDELTKHFKQTTEVQKIVYQDDYYTDDNYKCLYGKTDYCDYRRDGMCVYGLNKFTHYRPTTNLLLVSQSIKAGLLKFFEIQSVEKNHGSIKYRMYTQWGYNTSNWSDVLCKLINESRERQKLRRNMLQGHSMFFFYEKIKLDDNYLFCESTDFPVIIKKKLEFEFNTNVNDDNEDNEEGEGEGEEEGNDNSENVEEEVDITLDTSKWIEYTYPKTPYYEKFEKDRSEFIVLMKDFMQVYHSINFDLIVRNNLKIVDPALFMSFCTSLLPAVNWKKVLTGKQIKTLEVLIQTLLCENKVILGAEMGWGKTRVKLITILLFIYNQIVEYVFLVSKKQILHQWIESFKSICDHEKGIGVAVPMIHQYFGQLKSKKKVVCEVFLQRRGVLLCSFESMGEKIIEDLIERLKSLEKKYLVVIDELHFLRSSTSKHSQGLLNLCSTGLSYNMAGTGTLHCGEFVSTLNAISVVEGVGVSELKDDVKNLDDLKSRISSYYLRRRICFSFKIEIYLVTLKMSADYRKFYDQYCRLNKITSTGADQVGRNRKWVSASKHHLYLNETSNGLDLLLRNTSMSDEAKKKLLETAGLSMGSLGFYSQIANPKLYAFLAFCEKVVIRNLKSLVLLNSLPFLQILKDGSSTLISTFKHKYGILERKLFFVNGTMSDSERNQEIMKYKSEKTAVMVISMGVGEAGLDFPNTSLILSITIPRSPVSFPQMNYRIIRRSQVMDCLVIHIVFTLLEIHYLNRKVLKAVEEMHRLQDNVEIEQAEVSNLTPLQLPFENEFLTELFTENSTLFEKAYDVKKWVMGYNEFSELEYDDENDDTENNLLDEEETDVGRNNGRSAMNTETD